MPCLLRMEVTKLLKYACKGQRRWEMSWKERSSEFTDKLDRTDQEKDTFWAVEANENFYVKYFKRTFSERQGCKWCCKISFHGFEEYIRESLYWRETELCSIFLRGCKYLDLLRSLFLRALCSAEKQPQKSSLKRKKNQNAVLGG